MKKYESIFILKESIGIKKIDKVGIEIKNILGDNNILRIDDIGFKKLAYEIKGNKKGYFLELEFKATDLKLRELEKYYMSNKDILKFITLKI